MNRTEFASLTRKVAQYIGAESFEKIPSEVVKPIKDAEKLVEVKYDDKLLDP
jgi:hypothetical protein